MKDFHYSTVCSLWDSQNKRIKGSMPHYFLTSKNNGPVLLCTAIKYKLGIETISYRPLSHNGHFVPGDLKALFLHKAFLISWDKMAAGWQRSIVWSYEWQGWTLIKNLKKLCHPLQVLKLCACKNYNHKNCYG